jgi:hypothetical protein
MTKLTADKKAELEKVMRREDSLDVVYFQCLEIMRMPEKWSIDKDGNIIIVYPHPIVSREAYKVDGIKYLPHKSYYLPDVLLERHIYWKDILAVGKKTKAKTKKKGRPTKHTAEEAKAWQELKEQGLSLHKIGEMVGAKASTINYYIKKYCQEDK